MSLLDRIKSVPLYRTTDAQGRNTYSFITEIEVPEGATRIYPKQQMGSNQGEIAPNVFHLGVIDAFLEGYRWTDFPTNDWKNKPEMRDSWKDDADGVDSSELDDEDFVWIVDNYEAIKGTWSRPQAQGFSYVQAAINNYFQKKDWAKQTLSEQELEATNNFGGNKGEELKDALRRYTQFLHDEVDFHSFFGRGTEAHKQNIRKNLVIADRHYFGGTDTLAGQDFFSLDNFKRYISIYLNNIINPNYVFAGQEADTSFGLEGGWWDIPDVGTFTSIGDNNELILTGDGDIDNLITDIPVEGDVWVASGGQTHPGFKVEAKYTADVDVSSLTLAGAVVSSLVDTSGLMGTAEVAGITNYWVSQTEAKSGVAEQSGVLDGGDSVVGGQVDTVDALINGEATEFVDWELMRILVPYGTFVDVSTLVIKEGTGNVEEVNMDDFLVDHFIEGVDENQFKDLSSNSFELETFGQFFRTHAYRAALEIFKKLATQEANKGKAKVFEALYKSITADDKTTNLLEEAKKDQKNKAALAGEELQDEEEDELGDIRKNASAQCALLANLDKLVRLYQSEKEHLAVNDPDSIHYGGNFYQNRFYSISSNEPTKTFTKLQSPTGGELGAFLQATPAMQAFLVPKIKLQKVFTNKGNQTETVDIAFDTYSKKPLSHNTPVDFREHFKTPGDVFRGGGAGIKSISFDFDGETPATAGKYVKVELKMFFQDFQSLVEEKWTRTHIGKVDGTTTTKKTKFRYIDLLVNPLGANGSKRPKTEGTHKMDFYDPSFFRIKVDVGWNISDSIATQDAIPNYQAFKAAVDKANTSFLLCALDHEISVNNDGTVELTISYRGYSDTLLKTNRFNALIPYEEQVELIELQNKYETVISAGGCSEDQKAEFQASIATLQKQIANRSAARIIKKMTHKSMIHRASITQKAMEDFERLGSFESVPTLSTTLDDTIQNGAIDPQTQFGFFFLGDLLYTILDCQYVSGIPVVGAENIKIILTDFDLRPFLPDEDGNAPLNTLICPIASIPITFDGYKSWFMNEILGTDLYNMPVMEFLQTFVNDVCGCFLSEICFTREEDKSILFRQGNVLADKSIGLASTARAFKGGDIVIGEQPNSRNFEEIMESSEVDGGTTDSGTDFFTLQEGDQINKIFPLHLSSGLYGHQVMEYAVIYVDAPPKNIETGTGVSTDNSNEGILHFHIGADRGILKNASWSKQNVQYLRESRMFRSQGLGNYAQLATYYNVSLNLFGNFLLLPGMQFYLDPFAIGGQKFGRPNIPGSEIKDSAEDINFSRLMGIGGYHLVTGVKATITPQKFETSVEGRFLYSGNIDNIKPSLDRVFRDSSDANIDERDPDEIIEGVENCRNVISLTQAQVIGE